MRTIVALIAQKQQGQVGTERKIPVSAVSVAKRITKSSYLPFFWKAGLALPQHRKNNKRGIYTKEKDHYQVEGCYISMA